jgi:hypothetical protein
LQQKTMLCDLMQRIAEKILQTISKRLSDAMEAPAKGVRF